MNIQLKKYVSSRSGLELAYWLALPDEYDAALCEYPMMLFLHGAGERGTDPEKVKIHGPMKLIANGASYEAICVSPQCPDGMVWDNIIFELKELVDSITSDYRVNKAKLSCTGLSMGGFGTWMMGITYPELFSKLAPVCGGGMAWRVPVLKNVPVRAFHGTADTVVLPERSKEMVDKLRQAGGDATLTLYEGVGHNSWVNAYEQSALISWLIS